MDRGAAGSLKKEVGTIAARYYSDCVRRRQGSHFCVRFNVTADIAGNYRFLEELGERGMGEVFRGLDLFLERIVAINAASGLNATLAQHP